MSDIYVRMDKKLKAEGMAVLESVGLTASDAVRLLFTRIVADRTLPAELKVPNAETRAAMEEGPAVVGKRK